MISVAEECTYDCECYLCTWVGDRLVFCVPDMYVCVQLCVLDKLPAFNACAPLCMQVSQINKCPCSSTRQEIFFDRLQMTLPPPCPTDWAYNSLPTTVRQTQATFLLAQVGTRT